MKKHQQLWHEFECLSKNYNKKIQAFNALACYGIKKDLNLAAYSTEELEESLKLMLSTNLFFPNEELKRKFMSAFEKQLLTPQEYRSRLENTLTDIFECFNYYLPHNLLLAPVKAKFHKDVEILIQRHLPDHEQRKGEKYHKLLEKIVKINQKTDELTATNKKQYAEYFEAIIKIEIKKFRENLALFLKVNKLSGSNMIPFPKLNQTSNFRTKTKECTQKYMTETAIREITKDHLRMGNGMSNALTTEEARKLFMFMCFDKRINILPDNHPLSMHNLKNLAHTDIQTLSLKECASIIDEIKNCHYGPIAEEKLTLELFDKNPTISKFIKDLKEHIVNELGGDNKLISKIEKTYDKFACEVVNIRKSVYYHDKLAAELKSGRDNEKIRKYLKKYISYGQKIKFSNIENETLDLSYELSLQNMDLSNLDLSDIPLQFVCLDGCNLQGTDLRGCNIDLKRALSHSNNLHNAKLGREQQAVIENNIRSAFQMVKTPMLNLLAQLNEQTTDVEASISSLDALAGNLVDNEHGQFIKHLLQDLKKFIRIIDANPMFKDKQIIRNQLCKSCFGILYNLKQYIIALDEFYSGKNPTTNTRPFLKLNQTSDFKAKAMECTWKYMTEPATCEITKDHLRMGIGIIESEIANEYQSFFKIQELLSVNAEKLEDKSIFARIEQFIQQKKESFWKKYLQYIAPFDSKDYLARLEQDLSYENTKSYFEYLYSYSQKLPKNTDLQNYFANLNKIFEAISQKNITFTLPQYVEKILLSACLKAEEFIRSHNDLASREHKYYLHNFNSNMQQSISSEADIIRSLSVFHDKNHELYPKAKQIAELHAGEMVQVEKPLEHCRSRPSNDVPSMTSPSMASIARDSASAEKIKQNTKEKDTIWSKICNFFKALLCIFLCMPEEVTVQHKQQEHRKEFAENPKEKSKDPKSVCYSPSFSYALRREVGEITQNMA